MADDIDSLAKHWLDATGEMMADAVANWNRDTDCPTPVLTEEVAEMTRALVRWCDDSGRPIDPTPITECVRYFREAARHSRAGKSHESQVAFNNFGREWEKCAAVIDRIRYAVGALAPEATDGDRDADAYVIASKIGWQDRLGRTSYKALVAFLTKTPDVRNRSAGQRRLIHAGDWARYWAARDKEQADALELSTEAVEAAVARKREIDSRKGRQ